MVRSNSHTLFLSLLLLTSLVAVSEGWAEFTYRHVYVKNDLDNNTLLIAHCQSKQDDIGVKNLHYQEEFKFQFRPDFLGITLFFCGLTWDEMVQNAKIANGAYREINHLDYIMKLCIAMKLNTSSNELVNYYTVVVQKETDEGPNNK
ncbi:hypothetical protein Lal_00010788 [Lupinus albus]|nr:hypothetical protein Lal_00010788 [Lupinus albus]